MTQHDGKEFFEVLDLIPTDDRREVSEGWTGSPPVSNSSEPVQDEPLDLSFKKLAEVEVCEIKEYDLIIEESVILCDISYETEVISRPESSCTPSSSVSTLHDSGSGSGSGSYGDGKAGSDASSPAGATTQEGSTPGPDPGADRGAEKRRKSGGSQSASKRPRKEGQPDYPCPSCEKSYARRDTLHSHMSKVHKMSDEEIRRHKEKQRRMNHAVKMAMRGTPYTKEYEQSYLNLEM